MTPTAVTITVALAALAGAIIGAGITALALHLRHVRREAQGMERLRHAIHSMGDAPYRPQQWPAIPRTKPPIC